MTGHHVSCAIKNTMCVQYIPENLPNGPVLHVHGFLYLSELGQPGLWISKGKNELFHDFLSSLFHLTQ